jgi:hypothetical protein
MGRRYVVLKGLEQHMLNAPRAAAARTLAHIRGNPDRGYPMWWMDASLVLAGKQNSPVGFVSISVCEPVDESDKAALEDFHAVLPAARADMPCEAVWSVDDSVLPLVYDLYKLAPEIEITIDTEAIRYDPKRLTREQDAHQAQLHGARGSPTGGHKRGRRAPRNPHSARMRLRIGWQRRGYGEFGLASHDASDSSGERPSTLMQSSWEQHAASRWTEQRGQATTRCGVHYRLVRGGCAR